MGLLDVVIAVILFIGLWRGYSAGFVRTSAGIIGWFFAPIAATRLALQVGSLFSNHIESEALQTLLGFFIVLFAVIVAMRIIGRLISNIIDTLKLDIVNSLLGAILGTVTHLLIILVILAMSMPVLQNMTLWQTSELGPKLYPYSTFAVDFFSTIFGEAWEQLDQPNPQSATVQSKS